MKPTYAAYATLANGVSRSTAFKSARNAEAYAKRVFNERGACFVVRSDGKDSKVIYNTHAALEDVITHGKSPAEIIIAASLLT